MFVKNLKYNLPDKDGFFGEFGGAFVPENFKKVLKRLDDEFEKAVNDENFLKEVYELLKDYSGRPTPLYFAKNLTNYYGKGKVVDASDPNAVHENTLLNLDVTKAYVMLQWEAKWGLQEAIEKTVDWYKEALHNDDMYDFCVKQILEHGEHIAQ